MNDLKKKLLLLTAVLVTALGAWSGAAAATSDRAPARGERPIIVEVQGDKANGFTIVYADGSSISPPTDSESVAECGEYDKRIDRVRCRVEVRTWYRDLGDLQRTIAYLG